MADPPRHHLSHPQPPPLQPTIPSSDYSPSPPTSGVGGRAPPTQHPNTSQPGAYYHRHPVAPPPSHGHPPSQQGHPGGVVHSPCPQYLAHSRPSYKTTQAVPNASGAVLSNRPSLFQPSPPPQFRSVPIQQLNHRSSPAATPSHLPPPVLKTSHFGRAPHAPSPSVGESGRPPGHPAYLGPSNINPFPPPPFRAVPRMPTTQSPQPAVTSMANPQVQHDTERAGHTAPRAIAAATAPVAPPAQTPDPTPKKPPRRRKSKKPNGGDKANGVSAANGDKPTTKKPRKPKDKGSDVDYVPGKINDGPIVYLTEEDMESLPWIVDMYHDELVKYGGIQAVPPSMWQHPHLRLHARSSFFARYQNMPSRHWQTSKKTKAPKKLDKLDAFEMSDEITTLEAFERNGLKDFKRFQFKDVPLEFGKPINLKNAEQQAALLHNEGRFWHIMAHGHDGKNVTVEYGIDVEPEGAYNTLEEVYNMNPAALDDADVDNDANGIDTAEPSNEKSEVVDNDESNEKPQNETDEMNRMNAQNETAHGANENNAQNAQNRMPPTNANTPTQPIDNSNTNLPPQPSPHQVQNPRLAPAHAQMNPTNNDAAPDARNLPSAGVGGFSESALHKLFAGSGSFHQNGISVPYTTQHIHNHNPSLRQRGTRRIGVTPSPGQPMELDPKPPAQQNAPPENGIPTPLASRVAQVTAMNGDANGNGNTDANSNNQVEANANTRAANGKSSYHGLEEEFLLDGSDAVDVPPQSTANFANNTEDVEILANGVTAVEPESRKRSRSDDELFVEGDPYEYEGPNGDEDEDEEPMESSAAKRRKLVADPSVNIGNPVSHVGNVNEHGLLRHSPASPGINRSMFYVGSAGTKFCHHTEDMFLNSISYMHVGSAPKVWYVNPTAARNQVEEYSKKHVFNCACRNKHPYRGDMNLVLQEKSTLLDPRHMAECGVPVYRLVQTPGTFIITAPGGYHGGFNHGNNIAEAVNYADPNWLKYGKIASNLYSTQGKQAVVPFEYLLFQDANSIYKNMRDHGPDYFKNIRGAQKNATIVAKHLLEEVNKEKIIKEMVYKQDWRLATAASLENNFFIPVLHPSFGNGSGVECTACNAKCHFYAFSCGACEKKEEVYCFKCVKTEKFCDNDNHPKTIIRRHNPYHLVEILEACEKVAGKKISDKETVRRYKQIAINEGKPVNKKAAPELTLKINLLKAPMPDSMAVGKEKNPNSKIHNKHREIITAVHFEDTDADDESYNLDDSSASDDEVMPAKKSRKKKRKPAKKKDIKKEVVDNSESEESPPVQKRSKAKTWGRKKSKKKTVLEDEELSDGRLPEKRRRKPSRKFRDEEEEIHAHCNTNGTKSYKPIEESQEIVSGSEDESTAGPAGMEDFVVPDEDDSLLADHSLSDAESHSYESDEKMTAENSSNIPELSSKNNRKLQKRSDEAQAYKGKTTGRLRTPTQRFTDYAEETKASKTKTSKKKRRPKGKCEATEYEIMEDAPAETPREEHVGEIRDVEMEDKNGGTNSTSQEKEGDTTDNDGEAAPRVPLNETNGTADINIDGAAPTGTKVETTEAVETYLDPRATANAAVPKASRFSNATTEQGGAGARR